MANLFYPTKTLVKMKQLGIKESDIFDVFTNGADINGKDGKYKKYSGYELGLFYKRDNLTNEYHVTAVWKKDRR